MRPLVARGPGCPALLREPAWSGGGDGHCQAEGVSHEPWGWPAAMGTSLGTVLGTRTHLEESQRWAKASQEQEGLVLPSRAQLDATGPLPWLTAPSRPMYTRSQPMPRSQMAQTAPTDTQGPPRAQMWLCQTSRPRAGPTGHL